MSNIPNRIVSMAKDPMFKPSVRIGKAGLGETLFEEIKDQLTAKNVVKVKLNRGLFDRDERASIWVEICSQTDSTLVLARGNIGVLWKS